MRGPTRSVPIHGESRKAHIVEDTGAASLPIGETFEVRFEPASSMASSLFREVSPTDVNRGKISIVYPAEGNPYNQTHPYTWSPQPRLMLVTETQPSAQHTYREKKNCWCGAHPVSVEYELGIYEV